VKLKVWCAVFLIAWLAFDLGTKAYMMRRLGLVLDPNVHTSPQAIDVIPGFLAWQGTWNQGVTFGILPGETILILALTGLATVALLVWFLGTRSRSVCLHLGLAAILAGAVGNLYDRILWTRVRDFILIYLGNLEHPSFHWPNFNVADMGIVGGVTLVLWDALFGRGAKEARARHQREKAARAAGDKAGA
jgi:signal peptidase II